MKYDHITMQQRSLQRYNDFIYYYKIAKRKYNFTTANALEYARAMSAPIFY